MPLFLRQSAAVAALSVFASFALSPAQAQTLEQTLVATYESHPALEAARAAVRASDEGVAQARTGQRPQVNATFDAGAQTGDGFVDFDGSNSQTLALSASQSLYNGGDTVAAIEAARAGVESSRASLASTEQTVLLEAITAYSDVLRDTQFVALSENNVRVIERELQAARDRFEVGEVTRTDVAQAEARLAAANSNLIASRGNLSRSEDAYQAAVGSRPIDLAPQPILPALPGSLDDAQELARQNHPQIRAATESVIAAEFNLERAQSGFGPTVGVTGSIGVTRSEGPGRSNIDINNTERTSIGLNATLPLYRGGGTQSGARQAQANIEQAQANLQDVGRVIRQNVSSSFTALEVARSSIDASRQEITAARIAFEGVQEEATLGARTTLDVLDAEQSLLNAQSNLVSAERDEFVAAFTLLSAVGLLSVDHLGLDVEVYDPNENFEAVQSGSSDSDVGILDRIRGRF